MLERIKAKLAEPVDIASLSALRFLFGMSLCFASLRFLAKGWVTQLLVEPEVHFAYADCLVVTPLPSLAMHGLFVAMAAFALGIAVGAFYRVCCFGFLACFVYAELLEKALYLNHYYLVTLVAWLLLLLPAGNALSFDAWRTPRGALSHVPWWVIALLRLQVGVVYFFAGVAKLNHDWLVLAQPLRIWLSASTDVPWIGPWLGTAWAAHAAALSSAAFDLSIVLWLSWPKTRGPAFVILCVFHAATAWLFPIGAFPWLMTGLATIFFAPDWPRRFRNAGFGGREAASRVWSPRVWLPPVGLTLLLTTHCLIQCVLPLRGVSDPIASGWTRRGFDFAWRVMLVEKAGHVVFRVLDRNSGEVTKVAPPPFLRPFQVSALAQDPDLIRQTALLLARRERDHGRTVAVYVDAFVSMNGRPSQLQVNPNVDLTQPVLGEWIVPLGETTAHGTPRNE